MTIVTGRHLVTRSLDFVVLCTDSQGSYRRNGAKTNVQKIFQAGDYLVTGVGSYELLETAARDLSVGLHDSWPYPFSEGMLRDPSASAVARYLVVELNKHLEKKSLTTQQLEEHYHTDLWIAGHEGAVERGVKPKLMLFQIPWANILSGELSLPSNCDAIIGGSGKWAVEEEKAWRSNGSRADLAERVSSSVTPVTIPEPQDLMTALLDAYDEAIAAGKDFYVNENLQFAVQVQKRGRLHTHIVLPPTLTEGFASDVSKFDYVVLLLGKIPFDMGGREGLKGLQAEEWDEKIDLRYQEAAELVGEFYRILNIQLRRAVLDRQERDSPYVTSDRAPKLRARYDDARGQLAPTVDALIAGSLDSVGRAVKTYHGRFA